MALNTVMVTSFELTVPQVPDVTFLLYCSVAVRLPGEKVAEVAKEMSTQLLPFHLCHWYVYEPVPPDGAPVSVRPVGAVLKQIDCDVPMVPAASTGCTVTVQVPVDCVNVVLQLPSLAHRV